MTKQFNPYQAWLGVRPNTKPTYYELLGLRNFESEPPVLAEAADRAMEMVEVHRAGEHGEIAERVLRELQTVKGVLLNPEKRRAYDEKLRGAEAPHAPSGPLPMPSLAATDSPTMMLPPGALPPLSAGFPPGYPPPAGVPPQPGMAPHAGMPMPPHAAGGYPPGAVPGMHPAAMPPPSAPYGMPPPAPYAALPPGAYPPGLAPGAPHAMPTAGHYPAPAAAASPAMPGMYNFGPPADHGVAAGPPMAASPAMAAVPAAPTAGFAPQRTSTTMRRHSQRKQQNSSIMLGIGVLGGAVALLVVAMIMADKSGGERQAGNNLPPPQSVVPPQPMVETRVAPPSAVAPGSLAALDRDFPDGGSIRPSAGGMLTGADVPTTVNVGDEMSPRERRIQERLKMENLIPSLLPAGAKPEPGSTTPGGAAMPAATASATGSMPMPAATSPTPTAAPAPVAVAMTTPTGPPPAMEAVLPADAARAKSIQTMLRGVTAAWKSRDYSKAEEIILQAQVLADVPDVIRQTQDYGRVGELLHVFWNGVRDGVKSLKPGDVIDFNGKSAKVVRNDEAMLVVDQNGAEVPLMVVRLVPGLALQMAKRALPDDVNGKLATALFLGLDQAGDKAAARKLLTEAGSEGAALLPIVEQP